MHTIIVAAPDGTRPLRVQCDYCGSQHAYRGGGSDTPREAYAASREVASARGSLPRAVGPRASEPSRRAPAIRFPSSPSASAPTPP